MSTLYEGMDAVDDSRERRDAVLALCPTDAQIPGRWIPAWRLQGRVSVALGMSSDEARMLVRKMSLGRRGFRDWDMSRIELDHYRSDFYYLRPRGEYPPCVSMTQLDTLRALWRLLPADGAWANLDLKDLTCTGSTAGGACYFGFFRNREIIETAVPEGEDPRHPTMFRRGTRWNRVAVRPPGADITQCYHLFLSELDAPGST